MGTIPASKYVSVIPGVLAAGGQGLDIIAVMLTTSTRVPIGAVQPFGSASDVGAYFGLSSTEAALATIYFNGFSISSIKPSKVYFAQYPNAAVAPYLRGASLSGMTLTQLKAVPAGTLTMTFDGTPLTSASIDLSAATSFSNAASIIQSAFTTPPFTVTYDSVSGAFVFTGSTTGSTHTVGYASAGTIATDLKLTQATGAVTSQGADAAVPGTFMDGVKAVTTDWATFMTAFDPDVSGNDNKLAFAAWCSGQSNRFMYVCWDVDTSPATTVPATSSLGYLIGALGNNYGGTFLIGGDGRSGSAAVSASYAAFVCGAAASINFNEFNGRTDFAFKAQDGLAATCTNLSASDNLDSNGYNYYAANATANQSFVWLYNGQVSGEFLWADNYIDEIWMNSQLQLSLMVLFQNNKSIPFNKQGYALVEAACFDVINQAVYFGAIRAGVTLSAAQIAEMNAAAGKAIDQTVYAQGWYLMVTDALPAVRQARGPLQVTLWYTDGESVQTINLNSVDVL